MVRASQAFAPVLAANGGGAIINVLSDATWFARRMLTAYSAAKSAAWSFTNAVAARTLDGLENGSEEVLADAQTEALKRSLSTEQAYYLNPPQIA